VSDNDLPRGDRDDVLPRKRGESDGDYYRRCVAEHGILVRPMQETEPASVYNDAARGRRAKDDRLGGPLDWLTRIFDGPGAEG
jgi:hypothetical protein